NKVLLGASILALLALALGTSVAIWQAKQAKRAMKDALMAQASEASLRRRAQAQSYTSDINTAYQLWKDGVLKRARELLRFHIPEPGQPDLRGFEWRFLDNLFKDESLPLRDGPKVNGVRSVASFPDQPLVALCDARAVRLLNPSTRALLFSIP